MNKRASAAELKKSSRLAAAALFCLLLASSSADAATIAEYRKNIQTARELTAALKDYNAAADDFDEIDREYEKKLAAEIRRAVPVSDRIEFQGATIESANQWLDGELSVYAEESNLSKRAETLAAIGERLGALAEKVAELENSAVSNRTKDEDKQKLNEILRREEYQKPEQNQESWLQKLRREILEWFAEVFPRPKISDRAESSAQSFAFILQILLYALVLGTIGFLIYRFAPVFLKSWRTKEKSGKKERIILGERIAAGDSAHTLFGEAEAMARAGDLRTAIRQGYIALLCDLSDRRLIGLAQHKTNRDYLRDVRSNQALYENVSGLTGSFERHWYGAQNAAEEDWNEFRERYKKTVTDKIS